MPRPRAWGDTVVDSNVAGSQLNFDLLAELSPADVKTVVRVIIHLSFVPAEDGTTGVTVQRIPTGIQVVSLEAFTAGVVPDPGTAPDQPTLGWLYRDVLTEYTDINSTSQILTWSFPEIRLDLRANRKVDRGVLVWTLGAKAASVGVPHNLRVVGVIRALCLT